MTKNHHIKEEEREAVYLRWVRANRGIGVERLRLSGDVIPKSGRYTVHNRLGKLMLFHTVHCEKEDRHGGSPARFPEFGETPARYLYHGE